MSCAQTKTSTCYTTPPQAPQVGHRVTAAYAYPLLITTLILYRLFNLNSDIRITRSHVDIVRIKSEYSTYILPKCLMKKRPQIKDE